MKAVINANVVLADRILKHHSVIFDTKIINIEPSGETHYECEKIDGGGLNLIPGLIDQHIHGFMGYDTMDSSTQGLLGMAKLLLKYGVTGFLPTTVAMDNDSLKDALCTVREAMQIEKTGARILGAHLEGPYLNPQKKGAHDAQFLKSPEKNFVEQFLDVIRIITLAPEIASDFIKWAVTNNIRISLGHSAATYEQACLAFDQGASQVTHLFNGMSGIHHQEPGLAGASLLCPAVKAELIADTVHVRKELFPLIYCAKKSDGIILITDCMRAGGMPQGCYKLGNLNVMTDSYSARLADGSLAGSILTLNKGASNFEKFSSIPMYEAVAMASLNPARNLGIDCECGSIKTGLRADLVLVDDDMDVKMTILGGECVYTNK